jgi:thioredoxin-related protein
MKNRCKFLILFLLPLFVYYSPLFGQGIKFETSDFKSTLDSARKSNKPLFIDFYTDWCAPCKKMAKEIFPLNSVGEYFNRHFINIQVNAEKGEGVELARKFMVSQYPTFLFVDHNENIIYRFSGTRDSIRIISEGEKAVALSEKISLLNTYKKQFVPGQNDKAFLRKYVLLLAETGNGGGMPLNEYISLMDKNECIAPENINLFENITDYSREVMDKTATILESLYKEDPKSATFKKLNRAAVKSLSFLIRNSGKKESIEEFEELLKIKKRFSGFGNKDNILSASVGGGIAFLPEDEIRLLYYGAHKMYDKYAPLFEKYVSDYISRNDPAKIAAEALSFQAAVDSSVSKKVSDNMKDAEQVKKMAKTISDISNVQYRYYSTFILNGYENYLKSASGPEELQKVSEWIVYSYLICKDLDIARYAVTKLNEINYPQKAKFIIEDIKKLNEKTGRYNEDEIKVLEELSASTN